jgi:2',3'-cyclic-nucleotide 2'-phosphodiesterase (5'-nucleotidase family)
MKRLLVSLLAAAILASAGTGGVARARAQEEEPGAPRSQSPLTILQINDVYSTLPVNGRGGLARVATLKQQLAAAGRTPFLVIAGDFLSPSVASSVFKGEQMVAALNAAGLDLATLGNHEFDFGVDALLARMAQSKWQWVISNVIDTRTRKPLGGAPPYVIRTFGTLKVGFIGLCLVSGEISRDKLASARLVDPFEAAATYLPILQRHRVDLIVAVTHLTFADDRKLARRFPAIDLIVGGHEHFPITAMEGRTLISKAGSDARFVARIDMNRRAGNVERFFDLIPMSSAIADEPGTAAIIADYESRLGTALDAVVGSTRVTLDATDLVLRVAESNLGDLVADAIRADTNADVALLNAGSIRGNRVYPAGPLTRRTLVAIHPFANVVCKVAVPGAVLLAALNHGVSKLPATAGQFPQVSGLTMKVAASAAAGARVQDVMIGGRPLDPKRTYTVALPDYVLKGGDGYGMFSGYQVLVGPEAGNLMVTALERFVTAQGEIAPVVDNRIAMAR